MRAVVLTLAVAGLALPGTARADVSDLERTLQDLTAQTRAVAERDARGAARVEIEEVRTWLDQAAKAIQSGDEDRARRLYERVRAQIGLVDALVELGQIRARAEQVERSLAQVRRGNKAARTALAEKRAKLEVLKTMNQ